jgi:hypothetical protein
MSKDDNAPKDGLSPEEKETPTEETEVVEETIGDALETEQPEKADKVPLNKFMEEKRLRRDAEAQAETLKAEIEELKSKSIGGSMPILAINDELKKLATEHNVDEAFLAKLVSTVKNVSTNEIKKELEKDYSPKLTKIEQERTMERAEKKFDTLFEKTLSEMPEYNGIVSKDIIKALAFNQANAKKTLPQIIEDVYANAIKGRKSIETSKPSREPEEPNYDNPTQEDWAKIQADPKNKEKWSKSAEEQLKRYL